MARILLPLLVVTALAASAKPALAAAPANDEFANATVITSIPYSDSLDTTDATPGPDDSAACFGPSPTVWYRYTAADPIRLDANTFGSAYDTVLTVLVDTGSELQHVGCNDDTAGLQSQVVFDAAAGGTYYFLVGSFNGLPGGALSFSLVEAPTPPPPLEVDVELDSRGSVDPRTGNAVVRGTIVCNQDATASLWGSLRQPVGRTGSLRGEFALGTSCSAQRRGWSATVEPYSGRYVGGTASASAQAYASNGVTDASDHDSATIRLAR
jgi:hypothetical protein